MADADDADTIHRIVEATKLAFGLRDAHITDPRELKTDIQSLLDPPPCRRLPTGLTTAAPRRGAPAKARRYGVDGRDG
jgi:gamma-glutamyltranspeptidase